MLLLRHGAKVTAQDGHGVTPLGIAAEHGNTEALEILIQHGNTLKILCNASIVVYIDPEAQNTVAFQKTQHFTKNNNKREDISKNTRKQKTAIQKT